MAQGGEGDGCDWGVEDYEGDMGDDHDAGDAGDELVIDQVR